MIGARTFKRGVHPPEHKQLAEEAAIEVLPLPAELNLPLLQHLGAPCAEAVKARSDVAMNDPLGEAGGFVSAPVHAPAAGKTAKAGVATLPNGRHVATVPLKVAGEQEFEGRALFEEVLGGNWPAEGLDGLEPETIAEAASKAGLVGLGGAAFPTHVKLRPQEGKPIDTLLVNGCECEPYLTADYRVMLEAPRPVLLGARLAARAVGAKDVAVCVEDNKPQAIAALRREAEELGVRVQVMRTKYPQGGEKQLISAALGRAVPLGGLPLDVGVVVLNVGTAAALARAVLRGKPLTHRVVTVTGAGIREPKNVLAPIGASYKDLIEFCGGLRPEAARVVAGGPMMGFTISNLDAPITKGTSGITVLTRRELVKAEETACVRCGRCVDACPMNLVPTKIALAVRCERLDIAERYHINACMECGCCAFQCPASLPLVQLLRVGKVELRKAGEKN